MDESKVAISQKIKWCGWVSTFAILCKNTGAAENVQHHQVFFNPLLNRNACGQRWGQK